MMDSKFWQDVLGKASATLGGAFNTSFSFDPADYGMTNLFDRGSNPADFGALDFFDRGNGGGFINFPDRGGYTNPMQLYSVGSTPSIWEDLTFGGGPISNPFMSLTGLKPRNSASAASGATASSLSSLKPQWQGSPGIGGPAQVHAEEDQELVNYIIEGAQRRGIDPNTALNVARREGGINVNGKWVLDAGARSRQNLAGQPAYGPFQLHINGPQSPYMGDEALAAGIDPRDPNNVFRGIDFALDRAVERGWTPWYAAAAQGIGQWDGIGQAPNPGQSAQATNTGTATRSSLAGLTLAQYGQGLPKDIADAICGPIAAKAFADFAGRQANFGEVLNMARDIGWTSGAGMGGWGNAVKLIERLGVPVVADRVNKQRVIAEVRAGRPVVFDTDAGENGHYFVVEGYDANTDTFNLGESAKALRRSGGRTNWRLEDLSQLGTGNPYMAIYMRT